MVAIQKLITAVKNGQPVSSVRFRHLPDEMHTVIKTRDGKVALQLGKTVIPAELWLAKQTRRFRNFGPNTPGKLSPNSTTNANSVDVYITCTRWVPLKDLALSGAVDRRRSPTKAKKKSPPPTKKPSPVRKVERQIASGKGPDTIAGSNTYKALCAVCKKWGLPTGTIAQKADMATALIVEQWKKMTSAA